MDNEKKLDVNQYINNQFNQFITIIEKDIIKASTETRNGSILKGYKNVLYLLNTYRNRINKQYSEYKNELKVKLTEKTPV